MFLSAHTCSLSVDMTGTLVVWLPGTCVWYAQALRRLGNVSPLLPPGTVLYMRFSSPSLWRCLCVFICVCNLFVCLLFLYVVVYVYCNTHWIYCITLWYNNMIMKKEMVIQVLFKADLKRTGCKPGKKIRFVLWPHKYESNPLRLEPWAGDCSSVLYSYTSPLDTSSGPTSPLLPQALDFSITGTPPNWSSFSTELRSLGQYVVHHLLTSSKALPAARPVNPSCENQSRPEPHLSPHHMSPRKVSTSLLATSAESGLTTSLHNKQPGHQ